MKIKWLAIITFIGLKSIGVGKTNQSVRDYSRGLCEGNTVKSRPSRGVANAHENSSC